MSEIKRKTQILATIDHLRARKARPDINRICTFMLKKFKVGSKETKADLKKCIVAQAVFKVVYKGNVSYRNAAKRRELKNPAEKKIILGKMKTEKRLMTSAMATLIYSNPDYLEQGVPLNKLIKVMGSKENSSYSRKSLELIIERELESGGLVKMANGNFALGADDADQDSGTETYHFSADSNPKVASSNNSSSTSSPMRLKGKPGRKKGSVSSKLKEQSIFGRADAKRVPGVRVGERHKRAKKVFDPSDNNVPTKKKRGRPVGSLNKSTIKKHSPVNNKSQNVYQQKPRSESPESNDDDDLESNDSHSIKLENQDKVTGGVCSVCRQHKNKAEEKKDNSGILISCRDCSNKAHPSCLRGDGMLRLRPDNTWQCPHCKTCTVCIETNDAGILTVCSICADAYHALCHSPAIPERSKAWDLWECRNCQQTKNTDQHLDPAYIDKIPGSDHSSKYSDRSDSRKSNSERRRDKSSIKSGDSDERNDCKLIIAEKDEQSFSPVSLDNSDWKYSRKTTSPARNPVFEWKQNEKNRNETRTPQIQTDSKKSKPLITEKKINQSNSKSIYMNDHELTKFRNSLTFQKHPNDHGDEAFDPSIPDARQWNTNDVYQYFSSHFPEEAHIFKEKDIDGQSLLIMRRNDVIKYFGLPLGPALKMYRHVVKLQTRKDDFTMCWM